MALTETDGDGPPIHELKQAEEKYRNIIENIGVGVP
jgi:hypothetical protein